MDKKGRKLHFPSPSATVETRVGRPFTKSSSHKGYVEIEVITTSSVEKEDKGKGDIIENPIEVMTKDPVQKKDKGKGETIDNIF